MKNYKYLLFLLLITWIADAKTTRRRYPLDNDVEQKYTDNLALATSSVSWTPSSYFPVDSGYSNVVVNIPPQNKEDVKEIDYAASKSLADSKSAEEYVNKALQIQLHNNPSSGASSSSYTKYQGPSGKKTQHSYVHKTQTDAPRFNKIDQTPKPSSNFQMQQELVSYQKPQQVTYDQGVHQTKQKEQYHQNSYNKQPEVYTKHYTENYQNPAHSDNSYKSHGNQEQVIKIITAPNYATQKENMHEHSQNSNMQNGQLPTEYIKQIHDSVYKFMKEYNHDENEDQIHYVIKPTKNQQQNPHQHSHHENLPQPQHQQQQHSHHQHSHKIKHHDTYSHNTESIPSTQMPRFESQRKPQTKHKPTENNYGQSSNYQRKPKAYPRGKAIENSQHTYTKNVDLTGKSPKPVDLSALDVGQSWSHGSNFDHATALKSVQEFDQSHALHNAHVHKEPYHEHTLVKYPEPERLHFNEQTYHDINALSHTGVKYHQDPEYHRGYSHAEPLAYYSGKNEYSVSLPSSHTIVKHGGSANVGASISVGHKPSDFTYKPDNLKSVTDDLGGIQIINGIPVANPYKIDVNTLRLMLGAVRAETFKHEETNHDHFNSYNVPYQHASEDLPFDSYNPKYNHNPSGEGYQEHFQTQNDLNDHHHWEPSGFHRHHGNDLYGSATNNRPVKENPKRGKRGGGSNNTNNSNNNNSGSKTKITIVKSRAKSMTGKIRDLSTELKPPPIQKKPSP